MGPVRLILPVTLITLPCLVVVLAVIRVRFRVWVRVDPLELIIRFPVQNRILRFRW